MNLLEVFKDCPEYAIMKIRGIFPSWEKGQDIDIVCKDLDVVVDYLSEYPLRDSVCRVTHRSPRHVHFDVLDDKDQIDLRFDLYLEFISPKFTEDILDQRMIVQYMNRKSGEIVDVWITSYHQDILIKCWEYCTNGKLKYKNYAKYKDGLDAYEDR